jgi:hypothetical protein
MHDIFVDGKSPNNNTTHLFLISYQQLSIHHGKWSPAFVGIEQLCLRQFLITGRVRLDKMQNSLPAIHTEDKPVDQNKTAFIENRRTGFVTSP